MNTAFGEADYAPFWQYVSSPDEIFVFRFNLGGGKLASAADALELIPHYIGTFSNFLSRASRMQDVRGVAIKEIAPGISQVEIIYTAYGSGSPMIGTQSADATAVKLMVALGKPVSGASFLQLTKNSAVQNWLARDILWSYAQHDGREDKNGRTAAFVDGRGVVIGTAASIQKAIAPIEPIPVGPPGGPPVGPPGGPPGGGWSPSIEVIAIAGVAALLLAAFKAKGGKP